MKPRSSTLGRNLAPGQHFKYFPNLVINIIGIALSILGQVGQNVGLPIWLASAPDNKSIDTYFVLLYTCVLFTIVFGIGSVIQYLCGHFTMKDLTETYLNKNVLKEYFLVGFFTALNGLFLVFAAPSDRCPVFLQSALTNTMIPIVIVVRIILLGKIPTSIQALCAIGVVGGLFVTSVPTLFDFDPSASQTSHANGIWKTLWPLIFAFSFVPAAIYTVLEEKYLQKDLTPLEIQSGKKSGESTKSSKKTIYDSENPIPMSVFLTLVSAFQTVTFVFLFWYDLLPTIGYASSMKELINNFGDAFKWTWGADGAGIECVLGNWIFVFMYCITSYGQSLLLRYTEGAVYSSMVAGAVTPIGEMFWMLFNSATDFEWKPTWTSTSWYAILGLFMIVPCVFIYNVFGEKQLNIKGMFCPKRKMNEHYKGLVQNKSNSPLMYHGMNGSDAGLNDSNFSFNGLNNSPRSQVLSTPKR